MQLYHRDGVRSNYWHAFIRTIKLSPYYCLYDLILFLIIKLNHKWNIKEIRNPHMEKKGAALIKLLFWSAQMYY